MDKKQYIVTIDHNFVDQNVKMKTGQIIELSDDDYGLFARSAGLKPIEKQIQDEQANAERLQAEEEAKKAKEAEETAKA